MGTTVGLLGLFNLIELLCAFCTLFVLSHPFNAVAGVPASSAPPNTFSLSGSDWRIQADIDGQGAKRQIFAVDCSSSDWVPASVPGNIQADLEAAHQLKPMWYGAWDPRLYDVAQKDWWYRKDFVPAASLAGQRVTLVFEGVDEDCEVWLNGRKLGSNAGMFRRFWFDVADVLKPGQTNQLAVRIVRIPSSLALLVVKADGPRCLGMMEGINRTRQLLKELKSPTNFGWDWGVSIWTLGIWKDVYLVASGPARIDWMQAQTTLESNYTKATIKVTCEIDSLSEQPFHARFRVSGNGQETAVVSDAMLKIGTNQIKAELSLDHPALWWCNGQGAQPLYQLEVQLQPANGGPALEARSTSFGIRDVRWVHTEGAPKDFVSRYQLILNGRPVRTMGSCLIPPDLLFGRALPRGQRLLRQAKEAGMNMIRLWGGGVILPDAFYASADKLGIMLSLEFPLADCLPETDAVFLGNLETTTRNIVKQVRNHPAIIEYTGGNEMSWNSLSKHPAWEIIQKVVHENEDRLVRATCPDLGADHGPYDYFINSSYRHYNELETMRLGEFGTSSPANLEVWQRTIPPKSQWPIQGVDDPILARKKVVQAVFTPDNWLSKSRIDGAFGRLDNLPDLIQAGQFLGAEGLRYAMDALRRKGQRMGGFTSWDYNEPWLNGAGSYMVDYDGRPLMNYDFVKEALAPISLSLKYDSILYDPASGINLEVWLTSDVPKATRGLQWWLLARDRRGTVFDREQGTSAIKPLEVKQLKTLHLMPPKETALGPILVEMQLLDAQGTLLTERLHLFGFGVNTRGSFGGLLVNRQADADDEIPDTIPKELPIGPANLAFVGNGAKPATASSELPGFAIHRAKGLNDGLYGNDHSWIGATPRSSFQIDFGKPAEIGRFKLGRDRTGGYSDRSMDYLKLEVSLDGRQWQTIFEQKGLTKLPDFDPSATVEVDTRPARAQWIRATVDPEHPEDGQFACIDEFEVYAPAAEQPAPLPQVKFNPGQPNLRQPPVRRTELTVKALPMRVEGGEEILNLIVKNIGSMTAFFCEVHPLLEYRTDLFIDNNHTFIPPGEIRTITIRSSRPAAGGLNLAQTGWRISTWNADDRVIEPSAEVLLAVGRRDGMCREFAGYGQPPNLPEEQPVILKGRRPDPSTLPYLLEGKAQAQFDFEVKSDHARPPARLRIHLSDQDSVTEPVLHVAINGRAFEQTLPRGLGVQKEQPYELAFPTTAVFDLPPGLLKTGENTLEIKLANAAWVSLDALDLLSQTR
jgi:beta-mannosidase